MLSDQNWYAVRCLFSHPTRVKAGEGTLYEERITLWQASSFEAAFELAKKEAEQYASEEIEFLDVSDAFHLFDSELGSGVEVWSSMRSSHFDTDLYRRTFCVTPGDRAQKAPPHMQNFLERKQKSKTENGE